MKRFEAHVVATWARRARPPRGNGTRTALALRVCRMSPVSLARWLSVITLAMEIQTVQAAEAPTPPPLTTARHWAYDIVVRDGEISVAAPKLLQRKQATTTPRLLGRFAIELYVGKELLERVRFEIPLLNNDDPARRGAKKAPPPFPDFSAKARVHKIVEVPDSPRATYAVLVDRKTEKRTPLLWPPVDAVAPKEPAAGAKP